MDLIHKPPRPSIYFRTDYIVNSDMSIPFGTAETWRYGVDHEIGRHPGFANNDRRPQFTPIVLRQPKLPKGR
jgi:hypothetical protein